MFAAWYIICIRVAARWQKSKALKSEETESARRATEPHAAHATSFASMKSKLGEIGSSARGLLHADGQGQAQPKGEIEMNELGAGRARFDEPTADAAPNPADVEDHREVDLTYFHPPNDRQQHAASTRSRPGQAAKAANIRGEPMERSDPIGPSDDAGGSDFEGDAAVAYYDPSRVVGEQLRDESNSYQPMQPCFDAEDIRDLLRYLNACPSPRC